MNRLALTLGLVAMETCWIAPWLILIGWWLQPDQQRALLSAGSVSGMLALGALSTYGLGRHAARLRVVRIGLVGLGLALALVAVRLDQYPVTSDLAWLGSLLTALAATIGQPSSPVLAFAGGLTLWWRGVKLGRQPPTYWDVESAFRWGIGLLVAYGLLAGLTARPSLLVQLEAATTAFVVAFFFVSLITLALGRLESLRSNTRALALDSQWLAILLGVAAGVVLLALLLGQVVSFDLLLLLTRPLFDLLGQVIVLLLYVVVIPLAWLVELLIYAVLNLLHPGAQQVLPEPPAPSDVDNALRRLLSETLPAEVLLAFKALGAAALLAVGLWVIARAVARWRPMTGEADAVHEERDSVWQSPGVRASIWAWLQRLLHRRSLEALQSPLELGQDTGAAPHNAPSVRSARALYRELLRRGELAGLHRQAATTPLEYEPALAAHLAGSDAVAALTAAYVDVRYAERHIGPEQLEALVQCLAGIQLRDSD